MRRFFCFVGLLLVSLCLYAGPTKAIRIWHGVRGMQRMKSELYFYPASAQVNTHLAVVICPGGSYNHMFGIKREGYDVAEWLSSQGINAFVLRYRVGGEGYHHPAMIQDLQRALQIIRNLAASYDIDIDRIGALGFSAGGHLSVMAGAFNAKNYLAPLGVAVSCRLSPDFVAAIYPVVSMQDSIAHKRSRNNLLTWRSTEQGKRDLSMELQIPSNMPPTFLCACKDDPKVDYRNSVCLDKALTMSGIPHKFILYETGGHGFGIDGRLTPVAVKWKIEFINWIKSIYFAK